MKNAWLRFSDSSLILENSDTGTDYVLDELADLAFAYDKNGNMTKVTDALSRVTTYDFDTMNRLTKITVPGGDVMSYAYDVLGQLTKVTDFEATDTTYAYDFRSQVTKVTDPVDFVTMEYTNQGQLLTVTDGNGNKFDYGYKADGMVAWFRDTQEYKSTHYKYDEDNRVTKTTTGLWGTADPTTYLYDATTGLLSKVQYPGSPSTYDANYFYDGGARLTKITDWMGGGGLRYAYDDVSRLTSITDYDNSVLSYSYDISGNVITMNDYHSNATTYTYTATNQLSTITAPGSKVWDYDYNALGQPTGYSHPNGMDTVYSYDGRNRLTKIDHKDGSTSLDSFTYVLDDVGNVDSVTQVDDSVWDYLYDGRYRLTKATRDNATTSPTITATYEYTYDDGDNLLTKVHPFEDAFDDANYTGWTISETWSASTGYMDNTSVPAGYPSFYKTATDADYDLRFSYLLEDDTNSSFHVAVNLRDGSGDISELRFQPTQALIREKLSGVWSTLVSDTSADTVANTWYDVRVLIDGSDVTVWWGVQGGAMNEIMTSTNIGATGISKYKWQVRAGAEFQFDNIKIITDDFDSTTTYAYNNANELTKMTQPDGSNIDFTYDLWGRMTKKKLGTTYEATYGYRYNKRIYSVTTDWPGEANVTYIHGDLGGMRERTSGGTTTKYKWSGMLLSSLQAEENSSGTLQTTYVMVARGAMAELGGTNPATGSETYNTHDMIGSTRRSWDESKNELSTSEFTPYGVGYASSGSVGLHQFASRIWDADAGIALFPYRQYLPSTRTWLTRDPLGPVDGPNMYAYVKNNPATNIDVLGLKTGRPGPWPPGSRRTSPVPTHGNYCGPRWNKGKWIKPDPNSSDPNSGYDNPSTFPEIPSRSRLDQCCEGHDGAYYDCRAKYTGGSDGFKDCQNRADLELSACARGRRDNPDNLKWPKRPAQRLYRCLLIATFSCKGRI